MSDSKATNLLPCPFCGGDPQQINAYGVRCVTCGAEIDSKSTVREAKDAWNTRAQSSLLAENIRLRDALTVISNGIYYGEKTVTHIGGYEGLRDYATKALKSEGVR